MDNQLYWLTQNLSDVPEKDDWLGEKERAVLSGLHVPKRRNDWKLGRWTVKCGCRAYRPEILSEFARMEIIAAEDGGPDIYWVDGKPVPVSISISHSNQRGFCSVAPPDTAVGCDLERIENRSLEFFYDYFTPEEISFCGRAPEDVYPVACYLIWSAKESCLKILREGMRRDTRSISVQADFPAVEGSWNAWTGRCLETERVFHGWWRYEGGFVYTLASDRPSQIPEELRDL